MTVCEVCAFWQPIEWQREGGGTLEWDGRDAYIGQCRRNAPRAQPCDEIELVAWPETPQDAGCGQGEPAVMRGAPRLPHLGLDPRPTRRDATGALYARPRSPFKAE